MFLSLAFPTITDFSMKRHLTTGCAAAEGASGALSLGRHPEHCLFQGLLGDWLLAKGLELDASESLPLLLAGLASDIIPPRFEITFKNVCLQCFLAAVLCVCVFFVVVVVFTFT